MCASIALAACSGPVGPEPTPQGPAAIISIDSVVAMPGQRIEVPVRITYPNGGQERLDSLADFRFNLVYNSSVISVIDSLQAGDAISHWGIFYAQADDGGTCQGCAFGSIYVNARRARHAADSANRAQAFPDGILTTLVFVAKPGFESSGLQTDILFLSHGCGDNTVGYGTSGHSYYMANSLFPDCDGEAVFDTMRCFRYQQFAPLLSYHRGHVRIVEPENLGQPGDLDGNGVAFTIGDAVLLSKLFPVIYSPPITRGDSLWQNAGDCNRDGVPFSISDLEFLLHVITGDVQPSDTLMPANTDTLYFAFRELADTLSIFARATHPISNFWLDMMGNWGPNVGVTWLGGADNPLRPKQVGDTLRIMASHPDLESSLVEVIRIVAPGMPYTHVRDWQASKEPGYSVAVAEIPPPPPIFTFSMPTVSAHVGGDVSVPITLTYENGLPERGIGGLDLLVQYDPEVLTLRSIDRGSALTDWEYAVYRNAGVGLVRFVGIVDMNNGLTPPQSAFEAVGEYAVLKFDVNADESLMGIVTPLQFILRDCGDNVLASKDGTKVFLPDLTLGNPTVDEAYDPTTCIEGKPGYEAEQAIELWSGSVRLSGSP